MHRRALLAVPFLLAAGPRPELSRLPSSDERDQVTLPVGRGFLCPSLRARIMAVLHLLTADIVAVAFGADTATSRIDLLALVGPDGRLLALDLLSLAGEGGVSLGTRFAVLPDHRHIAMQRDAARPAAHGWDRESWTDYWRWSGETLVNAPARPVLAGTWQDALAHSRDRVTTLLTPARFAASPDLVAEAAVPPLPLSE